MIPFQIRRSWAWLPERSVVVAGLLLLAACETTRDRPTGLSEPLPATTIAVIAPRSQQFVPADSTTIVVVEGAGLIRAVEVILTLNTLPDTLELERRDFDTPLETVELVFGIRIPGLQTGAQVQFQAVAEDITGSRHLSEPVVAVVIECNVFPITCANL